MQYAASNAATMVSAGPESQLLFEIISAIPEGSGDLQTVLKAVIKTVAEGTITAGEEEEKELELVETGLLGNGVGHRFAKRLLQASGERKQVAPHIAEAFAALLHECLAGEYKAAVQNNRASFVVLSLVEGGFGGVSDEVKTELTGFEANGELTAGGRKIKEVSSPAPLLPKGRRVLTFHAVTARAPCTKPCTDARLPPPFWVFSSWLAVQARRHRQPPPQKAKRARSRLGRMDAINRLWYSGRRRENRLLRPTRRNLL